MSTYNLGPYRPRPIGEFKIDKEYKYLDIVSYNGSSYICCNEDTIDNVSCIGILPFGEPNSELYWMCLADRGAQGELPKIYSEYLTIKDGNWDFSKGDKIFIPSETLNGDIINIENVYNGACGVIITRKDLVLPSNSMKSIDYNFIEIETSNDYYFYTFTYTALDNPNDYYFIWHRTVISKVI